MVQQVNGEVRLGRGFVHGESLAGPVVLRGHNNGCCDVRLSDFTSSLQLDVDRGDLDLRPTNPVPKMDVELRNGNVELILPKGAKFSLKGRVDKGELNNEYGDPLSATDSGRGGVISGSDGDGAAIVINNGRGGLTVRKSDDDPPVAPDRPLSPQPPSPPAELD